MPDVTSGINIPRGGMPENQDLTWPLMVKVGRYPFTRSCNKNIGGPLTTAHHKNKLETSPKMSGHQSALIKLIVFFSVQVCISKALNGGRQKRYTENDICLESKKTLEKVTKCPTDDNTFKERSQKKNCTTRSTCAGEPLFYHCVISEGMIVEVCAPRTLITGGCCPFYNEKLGRVIEDFHNLCHTCPYQYQSDQSEIEINSECVNTGIKNDLSEQTTTNIITTSTQANNTFGDNSPEQGKDKNEKPIFTALVVTTGVMILVLTIICTYHIRNKCFSTVYDRSENNTDNQGSIKIEFMDGTVSGSSQPMIKNEEWAFLRPSCDQEIYFT